MRHQFVVWVALSGLLSACASGPNAITATTAAADAECKERTPPTGSHINRRDSACVEMTEAERQAARDNLQAMRDVQARQQSAVQANKAGSR